MKSYWILASGAVTCIAASLPAQSQSDPFARLGAVSVMRIGSPAEDRARLDQLRGAPTAGWLLRSISSVTPALTTPSIRVGRKRGCDFRRALIVPQLDLTWNSELPFERNDDGLWSGRGLTTRLSAGGRAECGPLRLLFLPELSHTQNLAFPVRAAMLPQLSGFASPFYSGPEASADLPLRFGTRQITVVGFGQSAIELDAGPVVLGFGSQSQWWGPGIRNAVVMSNHAAGIPSFYVRTSRPVRSPFGSAEARWVVGALTESPFFDFDSTNNLRSLSGLVVTLATAADSNLTLGGARVVYAAIPSVSTLPGRFLDAVGRWGQGANVRTATAGRAAEQITTLFARWVLPQSGFETYAEWARVILPASIRSLLLAPQYSQGYTIGAQWISALEPQAKSWRLQTEFSMVEQPRRSRTEEPPSFYVSPIVPQGYTQRGRVIGAAIGPGGSSQFIAVDRLWPSRSVGGFLGRIRWNNEQYYRQPTSPLALAHDVSLYAGLRGRSRTRWVDLSSELIAEKRLNYLFQSTQFGFDVDRTFDVGNASLRLSITP